MARIASPMASSPKASRSSVSSPHDQSAWLSCTVISGVAERIERGACSPGIARGHRPGSGRPLVHGHVLAKGQPWRLADARLHRGHALREVRDLSLPEVQHRADPGGEDEEHPFRLDRAVGEQALGLGPVLPLQGGHDQVVGRAPQAHRIAGADRAPQELAVDQLRAHLGAHRSSRRTVSSSSTARMSTMPSAMVCTYEENWSSANPFWRTVRMTTASTVPTTLPRPPARLVPPRMTAVTTDSV